MSETLTLPVFSATEMVVKKTEKYDADMMDAIRYDKHFIAKYLRALHKYHDDRKSSSIKEAIYEYPEAQKVSQLGRLYVRGMSGLQGFPHDIRNPLLDRYNWDCDMENAHYYLIVKMAKEWGNLPTTAIQHYIDNRDEELTKLGVPRRVGKTLYLKAMYGGDVKLYNEFYDNDDAKCGDGTHLVKVKAEVETIANTCWGLYTKYHKYAKKTNSKFSLLSLLLQTEERKCLSEINDYMESVGRYVSVLIHDGCAIEKKDNEKEFPEEFLRGAEKAVFDKTGHTIRLIAKRFQHNYVLKKQEDLIDTGIVISDSWAAERFVELMGDHIIKDNKEIWIFNSSNGTWSNDLSDVKTSVTKQGDKLIFKQEGPLGIKIHNYSGCVTKRSSLVEMLPAVVSEQNGYFQSRIASDIGKLLFPDGIYDFKTGEFSREFNKDYIFRYVMPYPFPARDEAKIAEIRNMVFGVGDGNEPFNTQEDSDELRHALMRAAIGDFLRKHATLGEGWTNSGKGLTYTITKTAFGDWVETFEGNSLLAKSYEGEPERENTFMMAFIDKRFAFSSEIKMDTKKNVKMDSNKIKSLTSGGTDPIKMRRLKENAVSRINKAGVFMFAQGFPDFEPPDDAMSERVRSVTWGKSYVDNPTKSHERKKDPSRVDYFRQIECGKAFFWVMVDTYEEWRKNGFAERALTQKQKASAQMLVPQFDFQEALDQDYEITGKKTDFVSFDEIKAYITQAGFTGNRSALYRELGALGLVSEEKKINRKATQIRVGIRKRPVLME